MHEMRGKTMRGPEAGINDGTCGTRSPRYCRPGAAVVSQGRKEERKKEREKERKTATPATYTESSSVRHRLLLVMRPGYYLFPLVCAHESFQQTNNLPFQAAMPPLHRCSLVFFYFFPSASFVPSAYITLGSFHPSLFLSRARFFRGINRSWRKKGGIRKERCAEKGREVLFSLASARVYRQ